MEKGDYATLVEKSGTLSSLLRKFLDIIKAIFATNTFKKKFEIWKVIRISTKTELVLLWAKT